MKSLTFLLTLAVMLFFTACSGSGSSAIVQVEPVVAPFSGSVDENSAVGTAVGQLSVDDGGSAVTGIVLSGVDAADFSVESNGTILVAGALDFETTPLYELSVVATNAVGDSLAADVNISVNNLAEAVVPELAAVSTNVDENSAVGTLVAQLAVDDGGSVVSAITLSGNGEGNFTAETNGTITVAAGASLDYELQSVYLLQAVATNGAGDSTPVDVNVSVNNLYDVILTTGQTSSYAGFDDGDYRMGYERNYTRDDINETVTDNTSGLMWQDNAIVATGLYDWPGAQTACENLDLDGYTDWRVPTFEELLSIPDMQETFPAMNAVFQHVSFGLNEYYWSSTTYESSPGSAWAVIFDYGSGSAVSKGNSNHVRCVR